MKQGLFVGLVQIFQVLFGLFSVKLVNIPMFLTFRRCGVLATLIVDYFVFKNKPSNALLLSSSLLVIGALIAGWETLIVDGFGYFLIWCNNFAQAF